MAPYQTEVLLEQLVERIALQTSGPRMLVGDVNHTIEEMAPGCRSFIAWGGGRYRTMQPWGHQPQATGKGAARIDLWLSPEMLHTLQGVDIRRDRWADHATVEASLRVTTAMMEATVWHRPKPFPWPAKFEAKVKWNGSTAPTQAYAELWQTLESAAGHQVTLHPKKVKIRTAPLKPGRHGEIAPGFVGISLRHAQWFRQLRRLQSLARCLNDANGPPSEASLAQAQVTWKSACRSSGFDGPFETRWVRSHGCPSFPAGWPVQCPSFNEVQTMFTWFKGEVHKFEVSLDRFRVSQAKKKRQESLTYVFQDCRDDAPPQVDTLCSRVTTSVDEVRPDDCSIVCDGSVPLKSDKPIVVNGSPRTIIAMEADQIWLDDVAAISEGDVCVQEETAATDEEIIKQFVQLWTPRWNKQSHNCSRHNGLR